MDRDLALARLRSLEPELRHRGVLGCSLFGSTARGEAGADSDVDVLIDLPTPHGLSALDLAELYALIEERMGMRTEVVVRRNLKPFLREAILADAVPVF